MYTYMVFDYIWSSGDLDLLTSKSNRVLFGLNCVKVVNLVAVYEMGLLC